MRTIELKSNLHKLIDSIQDSKTLNAIYTLLSKQVREETDFWDELSEKEKADIEAGLKDIEAGRISSHEDVMKEVKAKYNF